MPAHMIRHTMLLLALACLPGLAAAAGSQAGDNGRQPIGADNEGPRQAIPNATTNDGVLYDYGQAYYYVAPSPYYEPAPRYYVAPPTYYVAPPAYYVPAPSYYVPPYSGPTYRRPAYYAPDFGRALLYCDSQPLAERPACRDAVYAGHY